MQIDADFETLEKVSKQFIRKSYRMDKEIWISTLATLGGKGPY
jgi:hypothetical protein